MGFEIHVVGCLGRTTICGCLFEVEVGLLHVDLVGGVLDRLEWAVDMHAGRHCDVLRLSCAHLEVSLPDVSPLVLHLLLLRQSSPSAGLNSVDCS